MQYKVKSQLYADAEAQKRGKEQVLDDCTWSSCAAAVSWASGYTVDYSAADGVAAFEKATGRKDVQGISDAGGSLPEAAKTIAVLGGHARYATSWDDAVTAAKQGAALMVWVQQPIGYPDIHISKFHDGWKHYWTKTDPTKIHDGYGHMTSAGWCEDHGWQWACPTRDDRDPAEKFGVPVTEEQLRQIANSKVKAGKVAADYKCLLIVTHPGRVAAKPVAAAVPNTPISATESHENAPTPVQVPETAPKAPTSLPDPHLKDLTVSHKPAEQIDPAIQAQLNAFGTADWGHIGAEALHTLEDAVKAAGKETTTVSKLVAVFKYITDNTQIDEALLEAARVFIATSIAVALATGAPILDMTGADLRTVISGGIAASLNVLVRFLNPNDTQFGVTKK